MSTRPPLGFYKAVFLRNATLDCSSSLATLSELYSQQIFDPHTWKKRIALNQSVILRQQKWFYKVMDQVNSLTSTDCDAVFITNRHEDSTNDDTRNDRNNISAKSPTKSERKFYIESLLVNRTSQSGDACSSYHPLPAMPASSVRPYPKSSKTSAADFVVNN